MKKTAERRTPHGFVRRAWSPSKEHKDASAPQFAITCPFCGTSTEIFKWSFAGTGKRCSNPECHALHRPKGSTMDDHENHFPKVVDNLTGY